jgi:hypothetical protein
MLAGNIDRCGDQFVDTQPANSQFVDLDVAKMRLPNGEPADREPSDREGPDSERAKSQCSERTAANRGSAYFYTVLLCRLRHVTP